MIHADSSHVANHFNFISTYFQLPIANNGMGRGEFLEYNTVVDYYRHFLGSSKSEVSDIGKFGRGMCFYHTGYIEEALTSFVNIYNQKMPYLNYIYGHYFGYNNYEKSVEYL